MPIYEYACGGCNHQFEKLQKMSDPELRQCPACGEEQLRKLVSAAGFRLKGSGWYETDFKSSGQRNVAKTDAAKSSGTDTKSSSEPGGKSSNNKGDSSGAAKSDGKSGKVANS